MTLPIRLLLTVLLCAAPALSTRADVRLAPLFQDHAVLQSGKDIPVWGLAAPGEKVSVAFRGRTATAVAVPDGRWIARLGAAEASAEPAELVVAGRNTVTVHDVLVGEVWLCSGQSNMEFIVRAPKTSPQATFRVENADEEVAAAHFPRIRQFKVGRRIADVPVDDAAGAWVACSPDTVSDFTAVGYFFAREIHRRLGVPVGLINSTYGGTPVEAWMSAAALDAAASGAAVRARWIATVANYPVRKAAYDVALGEWTKAEAAAGAAGEKAHAAFLKQHPHPRGPLGPGSPYKPECLFNGMIHPLLPYALRGVLWYQGEANADHAGEYHALFSSMITSWRTLLGQGDVPFYFVQLANFQGGMAADGDTWAFLREAQAQTLAVPRTGMAVTIDIGDPADIHPKNKQEVGRRLALIAKANTYGIDGDWSGPTFAGATRAGGAMRVAFANAGSGLIARDKPVQSLEVAGADRRFHPASGRISGEVLVVSSPLVPDPVAVRYAWRNAPVANLYNGAGLPATPFRSDAW